MPASKASFQRKAHKHQRSPSLSPGNWYIGIGVLRSLPRALEKAKNLSVITEQTKCKPTSSAPVLQHPSRKKPVIGSKLQGSSEVPRTFLAAIGLPDSAKLHDASQKLASNINWIDKV
jgi:hypothetical protein